jgi:thiamine-monophosphate kinase
VVAARGRGTWSGHVARGLPALGDEGIGASLNREERRIARIIAALGTGAEAPQVALGNGDDAAVLERLAEGERLVVSVDACVEGTHFLRDWLSLHDVGARATMAAASDLAAMAARPVAAVSSIVVPPELSDGELEDLARGQAEAARLLGMPFVGGNLTRGAQLSIGTTVLGASTVVLTRSGARAGDVVALAGAVGLAGAGRLLLERGLGASARSLAAEAALAHFRRPRARIEEGLSARAATACIDLSDGLALDASRLARASRVTIVLDEAALASPCLIEVAEGLGVDPTSLALEGGEDYALLATFHAGTVPSSFTVVGRCVDQRAGEALRCVDAAGHERALPPTGFDHFG